MCHPHSEPQAELQRLLLHASLLVGSSVVRLSQLFGYLALFRCLCREAASQPHPLVGLGPNQLFVHPLIGEGPHQLIVHPLIGARLHQRMSIRRHPLTALSHFLRAGLGGQVWGDYTRLAGAS